MLPWLLILAILAVVSILHTNILGAARAVRAREATGTDKEEYKLQPPCRRIDQSSESANRTVTDRYITISTSEAGAGAATVAPSP